MGRDVMRRNATDPQPAGPTLSPVQEKALASLLSGATVTAAARDAGVDRATLHRWQSEDAAFVAEFNACRVEMGDAIRQELRFLAAEAVKVVKSVLTDEAAPASVRLKAASEVLRAVAAEKIDGPTSEEGAEADLRRKMTLRRLGI